MHTSFIYSIRNTNDNSLLTQSIPYARSINGSFWYFSYRMTSIFLNIHMNNSTQECWFQCFCWFASIWQSIVIQLTVQTHRYVLMNERLKLRDDSEEWLRIVVEKFQLLNETWQRSDKGWSLCLSSHHWFYFLPRLLLGVCSNLICIVNEKCANILVIWSTNFNGLRLTTSLLIMAHRLGVVNLIAMRTKQVLWTKPRRGLTI